MMNHLAILILVCGFAAAGENAPIPGGAASGENTPAGELPLPPLLGYTQRLDLDGIAVLTLIQRTPGEQNTRLMVEPVATCDLVMRIGGARVSRDHFLPYVELGHPPKTPRPESVPVVATLDGRFPVKLWRELFNSRAFVVLLRRDHFSSASRREPKYRSPELAVIEMPAGGGAAVLVRAGVGGVREPMPAVQFPDVAEISEAGERSRPQLVTKRMPLDGLTARTVKGEAVDLVQLTARAAQGRVAVLVLSEGQEMLDPFWSQTLAPNAVVLSGLPAIVKKK